MPNFSPVGRVDATRRRGESRSPAGNHAPPRAGSGWLNWTRDRPAALCTVVSEDTLTVVSERRGSAHYVVPSGDLDIATSDLLERAMADAERGDGETIVLDLSGLDFIDSTGLRLVIDANDRCGGSGGRLRVIAGAPAVERLLDLVGLRERLPLISP